MAVKTVTFMSTLMHYAREAGKARQSGDPERIKAAEEKLKEYEALVSSSDECKVDIPPMWGNPRF
jgi:hypothetical protein